MIQCGFRLQSARNYFQNHEKFIGMAVNQVKLMLEKEHNLSFNITDDRPELD